MHSAQWRGKAHFEAGIGIFYGNSGDNRFHKHWAHQIVVGLECEITVCSAESAYSGRAIWIDAGTQHCLKESKLLSIYLDPIHSLSKHLQVIKSNQTSSISSIKEYTYSQWLNELTKLEDLEKFVEYLKAKYWVPKTPINHKLDQVLLLITSDIESGKNSSRAQLASIVNLSPSRFSHWFKEQTGIPLRSYKKWLRMLKGIELSISMNLTDAALNAGFSDQAHFCRTVIDALGVNPVSVKQILTSRST